jgi:phage terminase large subunit-like protein
MPDEIQIALPKPYAAQAAILRNKRRNNLLILSRRWGKTTMTGRLLLHGAIVNEGFRGAWSAPTWKLMLETFEQHRDTLTPIISRVTREDRRIELINGSVLEYWSSDDPSAGRGRKYHIWCADESQRQRNLRAFIKGSVRPCLADFRGELWMMGTANGEGSDLHDFYLDCMLDPDHWQVAHGSLDQNPYIHPDEIEQMRRDLGPDLAAQELDSKWVRVDGVAPLVRMTEWDSLYEERDDLTNPRVLAVDGSVSGDMTALVGAWRDPLTDHYFVDYSDVTMFEPDLDGEIDYEKVEQAIQRRWETGRYVQLAYDPYQMVSLAQRLKRRGVQVFEFTQNSMRLRADSFMRQLINEGRLHHPGHDLLTEHVLAATLKYSGDGRMFRLVKSQKSSKIDLAVALSMALWTLHASDAQGQQVFHAALGGAQRAPSVSLGSQSKTPFDSSALLRGLLDSTPWSKR